MSSSDSTVVLQYCLTAAADVAVVASIMYSVIVSNPLHICMYDARIEMYKAAKAWSVWEGRISKLVQDPAENLKHNEDKFALGFARIENHYFSNKGFFPR